MKRKIFLSFTLAGTLLFNPLIHVLASDYYDANNAQSKKHLKF